MALSDVTLTISDFALGLVPENTDDIVACVGMSSGGAANTFYSFGSLDDVKATLVSGPLAEAVAFHLERAGGPVYAMKVNGSTAGANSAVTKVGSGPDVTLSNTGGFSPAGPADHFTGKVKIITGGAVGTSTFKYSLDGDDTWSAELATAATYAIPGTGITLNFAAGTYVADTTYAWTSTAPGYTTGELNTTIDALKADAREWGLLHVVGIPADAAATLAVATAVGSKVDTMATEFRYVQAFVEAADTTDANLIAQFAAFADEGVNVVAGFEELVSSISGRIYKRPAAWPFVAEASRVGISSDPGQPANGALRGIVSLTRDERKTPGLDAQRFVTLRTHVGLAGFYAASSKTMAQPGSDFAFLPLRRVINRASKVSRGVMLTRLGGDVRVNADGTIDEVEALAIEAAVESALNSALVSAGHASSVSAVVNRTDNLVSTGTLRVKVRVVPKGYLRFIEVDLGYRAIVQIAA